MNKRLLEIIRYKTGGRQVDFAALVGWKPQYLAKLLRGDNFGLQPVLTLLQHLPEINARWLLLGDGEMLEIGKLYNLQREAFAHVHAVLEVERFVPVMSSDELRQFEQAVTGGKKPDFSPDMIAKWTAQLDERNNELESRVAQAKAQSDKLCRQRTAKK